MPSVPVKTKPKQPWLPAWGTGTGKVGPRTQAGATPAPRPAPTRPVVPFVPQGAPAPPTSPIVATDPDTQASIVATQTGTKNALAAIAAKRAGTEQEFFDPSDPLSRQNALRRQFMEIGQAQKINQASSGQLYSGSSATQNAFTARDEGFQNARLGRQYGSIMDSLSGQEQAAQDDGTTRIAELVRGGSARYAQDVTRTPEGTGDTEGATAAATPLARPKRTAAQQAALVARVKTKIIARKKAAR